tara:strand:+ start:845 stop:1180 length:336 start_codon:yes stop_codon:yes gene_type:complete
MATSFNYVQGDTGPQIQVTLVDEETNTATNLTGATVTLHFRAVGETTVLFSRALYINPDTATTGVAIVQWQTSDLDRDAGTYEGEIEIVKASGLRETLFDTLRFRIREDFA